MNENCEKLAGHEVFIIILLFDDEHVAQLGAIDFDKRNFKQLSYRR